MPSPKTSLIPLALAALLSMQGCASYLKRSGPDPVLTGPAPVDYQVVRGGLRVMVPTQPQPWISRESAHRWGFWGTALAGGALAASATPFRTHNDAATAAILGGWALLALDAYLDFSLSIGEKTLNERKEKALKAGVTEVITPEDSAASRAGAIVAGVILSPVFLPILGGLSPLYLFGALKDEGAPRYAGATASLTGAEAVVMLGETSPSATLIPQGPHFVATVPLPRELKTPIFDLEIRRDGETLLSRRVSLTSSELKALVPPRQTVPPQLATKVDLEDPQRLKLIEAEFGAEVLLTVTNSGKGPAEGLQANLKLVRAIPGLEVPASVSVGDLKPGATRTVRVPLNASKTLPDGQAEIAVTLEDANGFDAPKTVARFKTRALQLPRFEVEQMGLEDEKNGVPERGEQLTVKALIRNKGTGTARDAKATLKIGDPNILLLDHGVNKLGALKPGGVAIASYSIVVKNSYSGPSQLPLSLSLTEAHPEATREVPVKVALNHSSPPVVIVVDPRSQGAATLASAPSITVDVDQPLPKASPKDPSAVAVVIGIERYGGRIPGVPFAERDARIVKEYTTTLLGVPEENLLFLSNEQATKAQIMTALEGKLRDYVTPNQSHVYVYYAGHGAPDPDTLTPYLVPYDGDPAYPKESCYSMDSFYRALKDLRAKSVTVMLDSCFSGISGRGQTDVALLADARPLMVKPEGAKLPSGVTVLAASTSKQISTSYPEMKHGLFTYFLLKGLRGEAYQDGKLTVSTLQNYLSQKVPERARRMGRTQTPVLHGGDSRRILVER